MTMIITFAFFGLLILGMPIAFVLGVTSLVAILKMGTPGLVQLIPMKVYNGIDIYPMMAMPLFILAGDIMNRTGITTQIVTFSLRLVGHLRGGLGHANILASMIFAGMTGSAVADAAALGTMLIPAMEKEGYPKPFAAAIVTSASVIGPIIPPSLIMVVYGSFMGVSVAGLFAAGIIPGLLMALSLMFCTYRMALKNNYPRAEHRATVREVLISFKQAIVAIMMPVIILTGILGGFFTPTEAAAIGVLYALIIGFFVYRNFKIKDLWGCLCSMTRVTAVVFLILATASIFGWLLASEQIPQKMGNLIMSVSNNKYFVLFIINIILLAVGCFMDQTAALIILAPVLGPIAHQVGVDPMHFGIIMCVNLVLGLVTPPLGACLFTVCSISKMPIEDVIRPLLPMIACLAFVLMLVTYIPAISLTIPRLLGFI